MTDNTRENIAETLARVLPEASIVHTQQDADGLQAITHVAVPKGFDLKAIDDEALLPNPRRTKAAAQLVEPASFLAYVEYHGSPENSAVWCDFNPVTYALKFEAVIDDHSPAWAGWRQHRATFAPRLSVEWSTWLTANGTPMGQLEFAEFLESHEKDIAAGAGFPSSLDMMKMATAFEANADNRFKSKIRTASGGVELEYVNTDDEATIQRMKLFERFQIGIPVFWTMPAGGAPVAAWPIEARLKYRVNAGAVKFHYELIRPDLVHELAAVALIDQIRAGLGSVPLRMGSCS